jgi:renal tumor antigen
MPRVAPEFRVLSKLGEGTFSEVFKVRSCQGDDFYAVKRLKRRYNSVSAVQNIAEVLSLQQLQGHPNIISLLDVIYDGHKGYVALVFELMDCNLHELSKEHEGPFDERTALVLAYQLLSAIAFLHSKGLFHRDIKPENCMVDRGTLALKLADFGSTRGLTSVSPYTEYVSTRWYRAPEALLTSGGYGPEVDEWAAGCMVYELLTARPLFPGRHEVDQIKLIHGLLGTPTTDLLAQFSQNPNTQIALRFPERAPQDLRTILPPSVSAAVVDLLVRLLRYNPQDRIGAADALLHPAFADVRERERAWSATDRRVPFAAFFLRGAAGESRPQPLIAAARGALAKPGAARGKGGGALADSRAKAGQRIKEWKQKMGQNTKVGDGQPHGRPLGGEEPPVKLGQGLAAPVQPRMSM